MASAYAAAAATKMSHPVSFLLTSAAVTVDFYSPYYDILTLSSGECVNALTWIRWCVTVVLYVNREKQ